MKTTMINKPMYERKGNDVSTLCKWLPPLVIAMLLCLPRNASSQDWNWNGASGDGLWGTPGNWTQGTVPTPAAVNVFLGGGNTQTIAAGTVESPGTLNNGVSTFGSIFGPEFGGTLNIRGTLNFHWVIAAVQNNPNAARTSLNMYDGSALSGVNLGLGATWWFRAPYTTMNMYGNAAAHVENLWWGGQLNLYGTSVMIITNLVIDEGQNSGLVSDVTRSINLGGGQLILPTALNPTVPDWITRGILLAYGKRNSAADIVITDQGTNIVVNAAPLGGALQRAYLLPVTNLMVGMYMQAYLVGDYPGVTGVVLGTSQPGVDPGGLPGAVIYQSSNTNVFTVDTNGIVRAMNPGSATLTASVGAMASTNSVSVMVSPITNTLIHRYSFNEVSGTTASDSVGGAAWDGALSGGASFSSGQLVLDGTGLVQLPAGIVTNLEAITIEAWATFGTPVNSWAGLYTFGSFSGNYISMIPHTGPGASEVNFGIGIPGTTNLHVATSAQALDERTNVHIVAVYYPLAGNISYYTNGVLAGTYNNIVMPLGYQAVYNKGPLPVVLGDSPANAIGASPHPTDPLLNASIEEFRIYAGPMSAAQVAASFSAGPNALPSPIGPSLSIMQSGNNVVLTWPTNGTSAYVLEISGAVGTGASWGNAPGTRTIEGSTYQQTVPLGSTNGFLRLRQ